MSFQDKRVLVVGGTSGLNLGIALGFAEEGAEVAVASRDAAKVDKAKAALLQAGAKAVYGFQVDVRDPDTVSAMYQALSQHWDSIDILVSGAAGNFPAPAAKLSPNGFKAVAEIDLHGAFHVAHFGYPMLTRPGGHLIHISAPQAYQPLPMQAHVCAAKAGVDMLTRTLAMEWGREGIRVNSLVPGPIANTEGMDRLAPGEELQAKVAATVPLARLGQWQDMANAAKLLSSPLASYITGVVLPVDGGWSLGGVSLAMSHLTQSLNKSG
ncbi:SDR family oxidoreductase [Ferrimonas balearica]|uniref:SDR family oxidoreductase n=1 Tax=Ferrimonas balearica TaxID=44012 RepID=UPI001C58405E|nr:SDR family oxidoreductase [Ferrimonas balearica]MBW3139045.1 SDR family oxidoreductase [Ferrimonas balearica]MBW3163363.1 SDR family oxidoreductase [Ferrimonas balearica]MBY6106107.1 SDR family oxidoreductase [Ferrimonas balearica]MBY6223312.1 SDR family oxidoreductase [Ferrimonas balearica]